MLLFMFVSITNALMLLVLTTAELLDYNDPTLLTVLEMSREIERECFQSNMTTETRNSTRVLYRNRTLVEPGTNKFQLNGFMIFFNNY